MMIPVAERKAIDDPIAGAKGEDGGESEFLGARGWLSLGGGFGGFLFLVV